MDAKTRKALEGSIKKWQRIAAGKGQDQGTYNCPLCKLFNTFISGPVCKGCPVFEQTGMIGCEGTPYYEFTEKSQKGFAKSPSAKKAARAEVEFLISLRPHA